MSASERLAELGIELPDVVPPMAAYVPAVRTGNLVYTAGQLPMQAGKLPQTGKVGAEVSPEEGKALARTCALNALAAVHSLVGIDASPGWSRSSGSSHPRRDSTANRASSTGPRSCSARCSATRARTPAPRSGCPSCRLDAPVEVEIIVEVA